MRWLAALALALALSVDGWGCGDFIHETEGEPTPDAPGWCCDGMCGLSAEDATDLQTACYCDGVVQWHPDTIGDCVE
jgi:hypothetical protein